MEKKAVLAQCKECCVTHSALLLQGYFGPINVPAKNDDRYVNHVYSEISDVSDNYCTFKCITLPI